MTRRVLEPQAVPLKGPGPTWTHSLRALALAAAAGNWDIWGGTNLPGTREELEGSFLPGEGMAEAMFLC